MYMPYEEHPYVYCHNNPINLVDLNGEVPEWFETAGDAFIDGALAAGNLAMDASDFAAGAAAELLGVNDAKKAYRQAKGLADNGFSFKKLASAVYHGAAAFPPGKALKGLKHGGEAAILGLKAGKKALNPGINITEKGLKHITERHTIGRAAKYGKKSFFNDGENIRELIDSGTHQGMVQQASGRYSRTFDVGRNIGVDYRTGQQTGIMTIITEADGTLVTAFPGHP